jgi:guanylate kinase
MDNKKAEPLIVISGPTGSGKNTIMAAAQKENMRLREVITMTTRPRRKGERQGREYFFVSEAEFKQHIKKKEFVEWARVYGNYYGTPRAELARIQRAGGVPFLIIDVQGAMQVKRQYPHALFVFIRPTPKREYVARIRKERKDEPNLEKRIATITKELAYADRYDVVIRNTHGKLGQSVHRVVAYIDKFLQHGYTPRGYRISAEGISVNGRTVGKKVGTKGG